AGATKDSAVKLSVPAGVSGAATYTADFTWILDDTPAN
ncbi:WxL domain-containing protein, partial [Pseudolactococcus reticulitermitis]